MSIYNLVHIYIIQPTIGMHHITIKAFLFFVVGDYFPAFFLLFSIVLSIELCPCISGNKLDYASFF